MEKRVVLFDGKIFGIVFFIVRNIRKVREEVYQELTDLVNVFCDCYADGEPVWCFEFVKQIVDGGATQDCISEETKRAARKQVIESYEWLQSLNVKTRFQKEILSTIDQM